MTIGIYQIRNTITGACYIGASRDIETRWSSHRGELRRGAHINPRLQNDWTLYGEVAFEFTVIEQVSSTELLPDRERYHAERINDAGVAMTYSDIHRAGAGLNTQATPPEQVLSRSTFTIGNNDMSRLRRITARRHPEDPRSLSLTVRELIREEEERDLRRESKGK